MSRKNNDMISSGIVARFVLFLIRFVTFPFRRPLFFIVLAGLFITTPMLNGVASYQEFFPWYAKKAEPVTLRFKTFGTELVKHTGINDAKAMVKDQIALRKNVSPYTIPSQSKEDAVATKEILSFYEEKPQEVKKPNKNAEEEFALSLKAGSVYGYKPVVVAQNESPETIKDVNEPLTSETSFNESNTDLEQPKEVISGKATAIGGDRLMINGKLVRLDGVRVAKGDADLNAQKFLAQTIDKKNVECLIFEYSNNDIPIGWCFVDENEINSMLVEQGFALSY